MGVVLELALERLKKRRPESGLFIPIQREWLCADVKLIELGLVIQSFFSCRIPGVRGSPDV